MSKIEHFKKHLSHTNNFIENNQGIRFIRHIFRFLGLVILIATGIQISYQLSDRKKEIKVREASHRHLLRENLYSQIPGSSGKGEALQELMMIEGDGLQGLDLSCERMKGGWHASTHTCKNPVTLYGLDFEEIYNISQKEAEKAQLSSGVAEYGINFNRLNFSGVNLFSQNLSKISAENAILVGADFSGSNLYSSRFFGNFSHFKCRDCELSSSEWSGNFKGADFRGSTINSIIFTGKIDWAEWEYSWAWADALPRIHLPIADEDENNDETTDKIFKSQQLYLFSKIEICNPEQRIELGLDNSASLEDVQLKLDPKDYYYCPKLSYQEALKLYKNENSDIYWTFSKKHP